MTAYYGEFEWGGKRYRGKFETLIDRDLFDRVQRAMKEGSKPKVRTHTFAFAGMIRCGTCGGVLTGDRRKGRFVYYFCGGKRSCKRYYAEKLFDGAMSATLRSLVMPAELRERVIAEIDRRYTDESRREMIRAERVRARLTELRPFPAKRTRTRSSELYRGCVRSWPFCSRPSIEPNFCGPPASPSNSCKSLPIST